MEPEVLTEVPQVLKRLVRLIARGFYTQEHAIVIDMLVRNPCMKEDDILELLKFERKQLRAIINTLKNDKFIKVRMRVETDSEGRMSRHNYYFISYSLFVNVVKYKLDHMRKKIETEERDNTSRASFKCDNCQKTFTDLEADQLFDFMSQTFRCTICQGEVEEDSSSVPQKDARTLLVKFNEQIQPIYDLLRDCEDVKLAPELMEPEPTDIKQLNNRVRTANKPQEGERTTWSGDRTRDIGFGQTDSTVTISMDSGREEKHGEVKERPIWMVESTVDGVPMDTFKNPTVPEAGPSKVEAASRPDVNNEIETLLIIHEKKNTGVPPIPGATASDESSSSESEDESTSKPTASSTAVEEMESEDDEDAVPMVTVGDLKVPVNEVTDEMVSRMTAEEKEEYIRLGQEMYENMYE